MLLLHVMKSDVRKGVVMNNVNLTYRIYESKTLIDSGDVVGTIPQHTDAITKHFRTKDTRITVMFFDESSQLVMCRDFNPCKRYHRLKNKQKIA